MTVKMLSCAVLLAMTTASAVGAQSIAQIGGPANPPPASFKGQQFIDSRGCLFLRAGFGRNVNWVARVNGIHKPICGMMPTGSAAAKAAVAADMAPDVQASPLQTHSATAGAVAPAAPRTKDANWAWLLGPAGQKPSPIVAVQAAPVQVAPVQIAAPIVAAPQPSRAVPKPPKGWTLAWKDDRLNPRRAMGTALGQAEQDRVWQRTVPMVLTNELPPKRGGLAGLVGMRVSASTMSAPKRQSPVAATKLTIQIGMFGVPANAQNAAAQLAALGLPVSTVTSTLKGKTVQIVYAGPFASPPEARTRLATVRGAGFSDAYLR
ncbi:MAG: SPOR domain-containing protein [Cypionkella sp.]